MALQTVSAGDGVRLRRSPDEVLGIEGGPSSRGSTFWGRVLHCGFEHFLANRLGWTSELPSDPLDTGLIWHFALETYYRNARAWQLACRAEDPDLDPRDPHFHSGHDADSQLLAYRAIKPFQTEPGYDSIYDKIVQMLDAYFRRWSDMWEILGVELTLSSSGVYGFEWSNKLDLLVIDHRMHDPVLRIVEHKSAYRLDTFVLEGYTQDLQVMGQVWLFHGSDCGSLPKVLSEHAYGTIPPFFGSFVNITSKARQPGCDRIPVNPSIPSLRAWEHSMQVNTTLLDFYEQHNYPKNYASCVRRYGFCEFFNLCRALPEMTPADAAARDRDGDVVPGYKKRLPLVQEAG